jgi:2-methylisocitrate lyase-like PEP mutase family enzyme
MSSFDSRQQSAKAEALRQLHHGERAIVFPNVWDATSARIVEELGYPAVATTSAGIANMLGYADGQNISRDEMLSIVSLIARVVLVPVTADMEAGYANTADQMYESATALIYSGAVGLNLEDSEENESRLIDVARYLEKVAALHEASAKLGVKLLLNARTDAYWWKGAQPATRLRETIKRANAFRQAGADCVFVPGLKDLDEIRTFLKESPGPLNVLGGPGMPSVPELEEAGVRRISIGSGGYRTAIGILQKVAQQLKDRGTYDLIEEHAVSFATSQLLQRKPA